MDNNSIIFTDDAGQEKMWHVGYADEDLPFVLMPSSSSRPMFEHTIFMSMGFNLYDSKPTEIFNVGGKLTYTKPPKRGVRRKKKRYSWLREVDEYQKEQNKLRARHHR